jgi:RNA polymerase sigma factor (TIGR02999 family)
MTGHPDGENHPSRHEAPRDDPRRRVVASIYGELHGIARSLMRGQPAGHTLQTTALVHEAVLKLWRGSGLAESASRAYLFAAAAQAMRDVLVDHARGRLAAKRGGGRSRLALDAVVDLCSVPCRDLPALDQALDALADLHPRAASVVNLRFFGGFQEAEVASELGISLATVKRDFVFARAWLHRRLKEGEG